MRQHELGEQGDRTIAVRTQHAAQAKEATKHGQRHADLHTKSQSTGRGKGQHNTPTTQEERTGVVGGDNVAAALRVGRDATQIVHPCRHSDIENEQRRIGRE